MITTKKLFLQALLLLMAVSAQAVPAKRGQWRTVSLANGSKVRVELRGDEFCSFLRSADGRIFTANSTGTYEETSLPVLQERTKQVRLAVSKQRQARIAKFAKQNKNLSTRAITGKKKGIIILVNFADSAFQSDHNQEFYNRFANEEGFSDGYFQGSVRDYFRDQSNGQFELDFDVVGPYTLSQDMAYYGGATDDSNDSNMGAFVKEACTQADADVNFADYDWDSDGTVDQVYIIYAGLGQANGGGDDTIWPHEWSYEGATYDSSTHTYSTLVLDGDTISTYACSCELQPSYNNSGEVTGYISDGIGTTCHEFSHCLGLPDLYDTEGSNFGMGTWSLMDYGSYNYSGYIPCCYTSYERWTAGWITPIELNDEDVAVTDMKPLSQNGDAYVIYNNNNSNEYYLLENRQLDGWDAGGYGKGLLVLHVDYDEESWYYNTVNTDADHQRCTIIHADNSDAFTGTGLAGDPYPYNGLDSLTDNSTPSARLYNKNTDGSYYMNHAITNITQNSDSTISFNYVAVSSHTGSVSGTTYFYESFDNCSGTGGNDNIWNGRAGSGEFEPDNKWTYDNSAAYGADQCAKFGKGTAAADPTTPAFNVDEGEVKVSFVAAPWSTESNTLTLTVLSGSSTLYTKDFTLTPKTWTTCEWTFTTEDSVSVKLKFSGSKNRFFLDEVNAYAPTSTGIEGVSVSQPSEKTSDGRIYTIDGRYVGTDFSSLPHGIYIQNGKKIVK